MFNRKQIEDLKTENSKLSTANKVWVQLSDKKVHYKNICVNLKAKVQSLELKLSQYERYLEIEFFKFFNIYSVVCESLYTNIYSMF